MPPYLDLNYGLCILDNEISGQKNTNYTNCFQAFQYTDSILLA